MVRMTGLEPACRRHQNLNLACLPIPPHPQKQHGTRAVFYYTVNKSNWQYL
jgi:hypothetical protein